MDRPSIGTRSVRLHRIETRTCRKHAETVARHALFSQSMLEVLLLQGPALAIRVSMGL